MIKEVREELKVLERSTKHEFDIALAVRDAKLEAYRETERIIKKVDDGIQLDKALDKFVANEENVNEDMQEFCEMVVDAANALVEAFNESVKNIATSKSNKI